MWALALALALGGCTSDPKPAGPNDSGDAPQESEAIELRGQTSERTSQCEAADDLLAAYSLLAVLGDTRTDLTPTGMTLSDAYHAAFVASSAYSLLDPDLEDPFADLATDNLAFHLIAGWEEAGYPADLDPNLVRLVSDWDLSLASERRASILEDIEARCGVSLS